MAFILKLQSTIAWQVSVLKILTALLLCNAPIMTQHTQIQMQGFWNTGIVKNGFMNMPLKLAEINF